MPIVDDKLKLIQNAATFEGLFNAVSTHPNTGTKFFKDDLTWDVIPKQFQSIVTVAKTGYADFVCSDAAYTSDAQCIQAAINQAISLGGGIVHINKGHYACSAQFAYTASNIHIEGDNQSTILDFSTAPTSPLTFISVHGGITTTNSLLAVSATASSLTLTVATGQGTKYTAGNWIRIRSDAVYNTYTSSIQEWYQKIGEIQQIESVSGDVITLKERLLGDYSTSDAATIDLVNMIENISFKNLKIVGPAAVDHIGISIAQAYNVVIENVTCDDVYERAIFLHDVVGGNVTKTIVKRANMAGLGYGLAISNASRDITVFGNHYYNCRHGVTLTGDHFYGLQYNISCVGNTMSHDDKNAGMFGGHPSYVGWTVSGNTCSGCPLGFFNGRGSTVTGNTVLNASGWGISIPEASENTIIANNVVHTKKNHCIAVRESQYGNHQIIGNTLICDAANADGISIANQVSNIKISNNNIKVRGIGINVTSFEGIANSDTISIWNNQITCLSDEPGIQVQTYTQNFSKISITHNTIKVPSTGCCIAFVDSGVGTITRATIKGNECYGGADSIDINLGDGLIIEDNDVYDATGRGILLHSTCTGYIVNNNKMINCVTPFLDNANASGRIVTNNVGYNPKGDLGTIPVPATTVAYTNNYGYPCRVTVSGGTVTNITLDATATGLTSGSFVIPVGGTIAITYSSAPTWEWWGL